MLRIVDIRGQGTYLRFAVFDTGTDRFRSFGGNNAWDVWDDLRTDLEEDGHPEAYIERIRSLLPQWALEGPVENEEAAFEGGGHENDPLGYDTRDPDFIAKMADDAIKGRNMNAVRAEAKSVLRRWGMKR